MAEAKMTKKDWFATLKNVVEESDFDDKTGAIEFLDKQIELLENRADKAAERAQAKREKGDELREQVFSVLTEEYQTAGQIAEVLAETNCDDSISKNKVIARLTQLVKMNRVEKEQIKDEDGKRVMAYKLNVNYEPVEFNDSEE